MVHPERMVVETIKEINPGKIVIFGANGMLGHALQQVFPKAHFFGHRDVDITDENAVMKIVKQERPSVLINAAAYTDVDGCEDNRDLAFAVNGDGPGYIAAACSEVGAILVHYSTDYIFDGTKPEYREDDRSKSDQYLWGIKAAGRSLDQERIWRTTGSSGLRGFLAVMGKILSIPYFPFHDRCQMSV